MTAKSIIQVSVDPEGNFKAFYDLYQEYQIQLESAPEEWRKTSEAIENAGGGMEAFTEASRGSKEFLAIAATQAEVISKEIRAAAVSNNALLENLLKNTKAQKNFADESERGNKALKEMQKHAEGVAGSIFGIGKWLIKMSAWGIGAAGLGGILSGFGLKDLASSAVDTQRSARGLGMTTGQLTAFNQDFGARYLDPSVLGSIANAQNSFTGRVWLSRASGEGMGKVSSEDPGQLAAQLAIRAHDWWKNTPASMRTSEMLQSSGFAQSGFSLAMMRQLGNTPLSELKRASSQYQQDQGKFNVGDKNTDAWYGFLRQIKEAGNVIETELKNRLVALAPNLQHFVDVIGKDAMKLIDDIFTPKNLDALESGIDKLSSYLGSKQFGQDIKSFADAVGEIAGDAMSLAHIIHKILHPFGGGDKASEQSAQVLVDSTGAAVDLNSLPSGSSANKPMADAAADVRNAYGTVGSGIFGWVKNYLTDNGNWGRRNFDPSFFSGTESTNGLPSGLLYAQMMAESHGNPGAKSPKGAKGLFQIMDPTARQYGLDDPFNAEASTRTAGKIDRDLLRKYGGDVRKMLAAYNWGQGNLDRDIARNGAGWDQHLPAETRNYLNKILTALARQQGQGLTVRVENNTSARVAVQANAAAAQ